MPNQYCVFKGKLVMGVPFLDGYKGNPHYAIVVENSDGTQFVVLANVKSDSTMPGAGQAGYHVLYYWDQYFIHPMTSDLDTIANGLHTANFPTLDYVHDQRLVADLSRMRPIALDTEGQKNDINALVNQMLALDMSVAPVPYDYHGAAGVDHRRGWRPTGDVMVYGFGFLFEPEQDGLHETHMNQGNPIVREGKDHSNENGVHQDGAVIVEIGGKFQALLIAFQTQLIPTDNRGYPVSTAHPILSCPQSCRRREDLAIWFVRAAIGSRLLRAFTYDVLLAEAFASASLASANEMMRQAPRAQIYLQPELSNSQDAFHVGPR